MAARREQPFASLSAADAHPRLSTHHNELDNALVSSPHTFGRLWCSSFCSARPSTAVWDTRRAPNVASRCGQSLVALELEPARAFSVKPRRYESLGMV